MNTQARLPLCLIPARGGSKRIPRKNVALLGNRPLLAWSIAPALASGLFAAVVVSSEDKEILSIARRYGALAVPRPAELAGDNCTLREVCLAILPQLAAETQATDLYLLAPTAPFRTAETLRLAWRRYLESGGSALVSVEPWAYPPQWALTVREGRLEPMFPDLYETPRPLLPTTLKHDGGHLITGIARFLEEKNFWGTSACPFHGPEAERLDIDLPEDLARARAALERHDRPQPPEGQPPEA
jgi:CMP-N-acetylneuraminic acid synthetase